MRVVMTLLARDEADIVDAQIAFHLHAGVDFMIATDHGSNDGTTEILERYEQQGCLRLIREEGVDVRQSDWVTRMARLAAREHQADWVVNADADEFWWPREGSLKDVFAAIPGRFGVVRGAWRHFLPRPDDGEFFAERMVVRLARPAHPGAKKTVFHAHQKVAHRGAKDVHVEIGNHDVVGTGLQPLRGWLPIEVLHFSFRTVEQVEKKGRGGWWSSPAPDLAEHIALLGRAAAEGRIEEHLRGLTVDDEAVRAGLADGTLAIDTRLRDVLRRLRRDDGTFAPPDPGAPGHVAVPHPTPQQDADFAAEVAPLATIDSLIRAEERVRGLERRLENVERGARGVARRLARR